MPYIDCVDWNPQSVDALARTAVTFGFSGLIYNENVDAGAFKIGQHKAHASRITLTDPPLLLKQHGFELRDDDITALGLLAPHLPRKASSTKSSERTLAQIRRVTIHLSHPSQIGFLNTVARSHAYDLVAVSPSDEKCWLTLLSQGEFDIISLDLTCGRLAFPLRRHHISQLCRRNVYFEIRLAEALRDSSARKSLFSNIQQLVRFVPHDQIIFSSGASHPLGLRAPQDMASVAKLMGIAGRTQNVVSDNVMRCLYKGAARRTAGGVARFIEGS